MSEVNCGRPRRSELSEEVGPHFGRPCEGCRTSRDGGERLDPRAGEGREGAEEDPGRVLDAS